MEYLLAYNITSNLDATCFFKVPALFVTLGVTFLKRFRIVSLDISNPSFVLSLLSLSNSAMV
jgi:hypothetical protein